MRSLALLFLLLAPLEAETPARDESFRIGEAALSDGLWEVAAIHFQGLVSRSSTSPEEKAAAGIRLAEAWVRGGKPAEALELLADPEFAKAPGYHFWKGQALAGTGRGREAERELLLDTRYPLEAALTRCSILLAAGETEKALGVLHPLTAHLDPAIALAAKLREVEILTGSGRFAEARRLMPPLEEIPEGQHARAVFIEGLLLLAEKRPGEAATHFSTLLPDASGQTLSAHHAAAVGYADAVAAQDHPADAAEFLLGFLQQHPDTPLLDQIFGRLLAWLPEEPLPNHLILERLAQWIPAASLPSRGIIAGDEGPASAWPVEPPAGNDLAAHAMHARAMGLLRISSPAARAEARLLMARLVAEYPRSPLVAVSLYEYARWLLQRGETERASLLLDTVREITADPELAGRAVFLKAKAAFGGGNFQTAVGLFRQAAGVLAGPAAELSNLNASISLIRMGAAAAAAAPGTAEDPAMEADMELERALSATPATRARVEIEAFLTKYPKHARVAEARLAAAEAALSTSPPDLSMAKAQLDTISAEPGALDSLPAARVALARLRLTDASGDPKATAAAARSFLEAYPDDASAAEVSLTLGRALFQTESYNDARLVLQKLASSDSNAARSQAAWLLAARSAAMGATPQSREEALALFDKAAAVDGALDPIILMEKARLMIDLNRLAEAQATLTGWYHSLPADDRLRIPAGLLYGEAAYAQGARKPEALAEALSIYEGLLRHPGISPALVNRIQYLRGMTLEQLPSAGDPAVKRESEALDAYYSVLENAGNPPAEWHYLERAGFRALEILERDGPSRAPAALKIAKKIASLKGPRAEEAATRARQIQLKNSIWED